MSARGWAPTLAILLAALLWGLWWIPVRALDAAGLGGHVINLLVYGILSLALLPLAWHRRARFGDRILLVSALCFGLAMALWNHAVLNGEVVRAVLLFYLAPVWATIFARLWLGQAIVPRRLLAIVFGLGGAAVILGAGRAGGDVVPLPRDPGDWFGLLSGVLFAISATLTRLRGHGGDLERSYVAIVVVALSGGLGLVLLPAIELPPWGTLAGALPAVTGAALAWMLPAIWLVFWAAARLDPGRVTLLLLSEVVAASVSAAVLTDEPFAARELVGCLLVITAGVLEGLPARRRATAGAGLS